MKQLFFILDVHIYYTQNTQQQVSYSTFHLGADALVAVAVSRLVTPDGCRPCSRALHTSSHPHPGGTQEEQVVAQGITQYEGHEEGAVVGHRHQHQQQGEAVAEAREGGVGDAQVGDTSLFCHIEDAGASSV